MFLFDSGTKVHIISFLSKFLGTFFDGMKEKT